MRSTTELRNEYGGWDENAFSPEVTWHIFQTAAWIASAPSWRWWGAWSRFRCCPPAMPRWWRWRRRRPRWLAPAWRRTRDARSWPPGWGCQRWRLLWRRAEATPGPRWRKLERKRINFKSCGIWLEPIQPILVVGLRKLAYLLFLNFFLPFTQQVNLLIWDVITN